jgi:hypothetical protein
MSVFTDHTAAFEAAFATIAETVSYNGADVLGSVTYAETAGALIGAAGMADAAELDVLKSEVAAPQRKDSVVIGGVTWTVMRVVSGDEWGWRLLIITNERPSRR